jgi:phosphatidylethanolamine/phosphatidyl-N-methylethanolamine N-methyltransferase
MNAQDTEHIYDKHSYFYDAFFGRLVRRRVEEAIGRMRLRPGQRVLDVGVGTGVSLEFYPRGVDVVGVDLSQGMLRQALRRVRSLNCRDNATLVRCDAQRLPFERGAFDHVFLSHVISVVPDPVELLREVRRVAKPGAKLVIVNHFLSENRFVAMVERLINPMCMRLGWRSDLALPRLVREAGMEIDYRYKLELFDIWETVVLTNREAAPGRGPDDTDGVPALATA